MPPGGIMLGWEVSVWQWDCLSSSESQEPSDVEMPAGPGVTLAVTRVSPRKIRALPSLLHPNPKCSNSVSKCYSSQVPCQLSQGCSGLAHLTCHWCCARQRNSAFPCPSSTCRPRVLIQKSAALPTVPKSAPKFQLMAQT